MVVRKMKEKCKDAARMRREKERAEFLELAKLLPLPSSTTSQLDKASIIRLTSSYLRIRSAFPEGLGGNWGKERSYSSTHYHNHHHHLQRANNEAIPSQQYSSKLTKSTITHSFQQQQVKELGSLILQTLDGFAFALHRDGKIMYISETASVHLGLPQIDLTGSSVFEYIHPSDHNDIYELLSLSELDKAQLRAGQQSGSAGVKELGRSFCMRMKCILPKRNAGLVSNGYKAIHCSGYLKCRLSSDSVESNNNGTGAEQSISSSNQQRTNTAGNPTWSSYALVAVGHSLLPTASTEVKLTGNSFMFRANLDLKLYYIEAPVIKLLGFEQVEMIGQSLYQFVHAADLANLDTSHRSLLDKGQVVTKYYRLMRKNGGFIWVQSYASLVNNPRNMPKPQHVVSICFVLGDNKLDKSCILRQPEEQNLRISSSIGSNKSGLRELNSVCSPSPMRKQKVPSTRLVEQKSSIKKDKHSSGCSLKRNRRSKQSNMKTVNQQVAKHCHNRNSIEASQQQQSAAIVSIRDNCNDPSIVLPDHYHHQAYACLPSAQINLNNNKMTIGSIRRPSDDSSSIVSSVASTCLSSVSSSSHNNSDQFMSLYQTTNDNYTINNSVPPHTELLIQGNPSYQQLDTPVKTTNLLIGDSTNALYGEEAHILLNRHHEHLQQEPSQAVTCNTGNQYIIAPLRSNSLNNPNWLSPVSIQSSGHELDDHCKLVQTHLSSEQQNPSFSLNSCQLNQFATTTDWPQATSNQCPNLFFDHQQHSTSLSSFECTDDRLSGACFYPETQIGAHYQHELSPYLNSTSTIHYQQSVPVNNGYTMSSM